MKKKRHSTPVQRRQPDPNAIGRTFKRRLRAGETIIGAMVFEYLRPSLVKIFKRAGFDFIFIEKEHGIFDSKELPDFVLSARDNKVPVISKIGQLNRSEVTRLLDSGVVGIQLPRTESREQLSELIEYMNFPPIGSRAGAPCFGNVDYSWASDYDVGGRGWQKGANAATL
jgi:2-dehydro-3-deoxyglucarate aldolase/4-hydroxy-2-oxoheptanedioate aldolase